MEQAKGQDTLTMVMIDFLPPRLMAEASDAGELVSHAIEDRDQQESAQHDEVCSIKAS